MRAQKPHHPAISKFFRQAFHGPQNKRNYPLFNRQRAFQARRLVARLDYPVLDLATRTKIRTCEAIMRGTRKVGSNPSGNSRNGAIDCQSLKPARSAMNTTKTMSSKPALFQIRRSLRDARNFGTRRIMTVAAATAMSPMPAGAANAQSNSPRRQRIRK